MIKRTVIVGIAILATAAGALFWWNNSHTIAARPPREIDFRVESFSINVFPPNLAEINSRRIGTLLNEALIRMDEHGRLGPGLAASWSHEGTTWRFRMRRDAQFSDGRPVTPEDARSSLCRSMQPSAAWGWLLDSIQHENQGSTIICPGLRVSGNDLIIEQDYDAPWLAEVLAGPAGWILPGNIVKGGAYGEAPGAGRYKIAQVSPNSYVLLSAVEPKSGLPAVRFRYVPDDSQAASLFRAGQLTFLYLQTPLLKQAVGQDRNAAYKVQSRSFDRIRVLILNKAGLSRKGFSLEQIRAFRDALDSSIDRQGLARNSQGIAEAEAHPLPLFGTTVRPAPPSDAIASLPAVTLTIRSEPDAFSDQIAESLPHFVGKVRLKAEPTEKGLLLKSLVDGNYDIVEIVLEATVHSPRFWEGFFAPNGPFVAFGTPIQELNSIDLTRPEGLARLDAALAHDGNWIVLLHEHRYDAFQPWLGGLSYTPAGQDDLSAVRLTATGPSR